MFTVYAQMPWCISPHVPFIHHVLIACLPSNES